MLRSVYVLFLVLVVVDGTIQLGFIENVAYVSDNLTNVLSYNGTCSECICYGFFSDLSINYEIINCYKNNKSCLLFPNYLSPSMIRINTNSTLVLKPSQTTAEIPAVTTMDAATTTVVPSETTSGFQCYIPKWNATGITFAYNGSSLNQTFNAYGLFIAPNSDTLYIADSGNHRILKWLSGAASGTLIAGGQGQGSNVTQLKSPREVFVDRNENLFVGDSYNYRIQYFINGSSVGRTIAGNGTSGSAYNLFKSILGLGVDFAGNVYVSDFSSQRVTKWPPNATYGLLVAGNGTAGNDANLLNIPSALYVDPTTGTLYIPNQNGHCVTKWLAGSSTGSVVAGVCGVQGLNETLLTRPTCVTFDKYGNMYVTDGNSNGRIMMFCPNSLIGIPVVTSGLSNAISIAVDKNLNIYVSDFNNNRIMKYTLL